MTRTTTILFGSTIVAIPVTLGAMRFLVEQMPPTWIACCNSTARRPWPFDVRTHTIRHGEWREGWMDGRTILCSDEMNWSPALLWWWY